MKHNSEAYALVIEAKNILSAAYDIYHGASRGERVAVHSRELGKSIADMSYKVSIFNESYEANK